MTDQSDPATRNADNDSDTDTVNENSIMDRSLDLDLADAPEIWVRIIQYAGAAGGFETLANGEVWSTEIDDWAIFVNCSELSITTKYEPFGVFLAKSGSATVFRTGSIVGAVHKDHQEFIPSPGRPMEERLLEAINDRLDEAEYTLERADERARGD